MDPVVVIARRQVVICILHCCMALGRLPIGNTQRFANNGLPPVIR